MTAFTPRVSGVGDSGDDATGARHDRRSDRPRPVEDAEGPAPGPWENVGSDRAVDPVWPDAERPGRDAQRSRRRAVSAIREVPVDAAVVDLAEREHLVSPAPVEDRGGRVIDIREDVQRRARESRQVPQADHDVPADQQAQAEDRSTGGRPDESQPVVGRFGGPLDDHPPRDGADVPRQDEHELPWGAPVATSPALEPALPVAPSPVDLFPAAPVLPVAVPPVSAPTGRRRQSVTSQQQPQTSYAPVTLHPASDVEPAVDLTASPRGARAARRGQTAPEDQGPLVERDQQATPANASLRADRESAVEARTPHGATVFDPSRSGRGTDVEASPFAPVPPDDSSLLPPVPADDSSPFAPVPAEEASPFATVAAGDGSPPAPTIDRSRLAPAAGGSPFDQPVGADGSPFDQVPAGRGSADEVEPDRPASAGATRQMSLRPQPAVTDSVLPPRVVDPAAAELFGGVQPHGASPARTRQAVADDQAVVDDRAADDQDDEDVPDGADAEGVANHEDDAPHARPGARHRAVTAPASVNRRVRQISLGAAGLSLLVVVALWAAAGGLSDLLSPAPAIGSLSRLAGLIGTDLLLIQVLLMARIPAVERAFGRAVLTRWHTLAGMVSFGFIVAHIVLSISGTAIIERFNIFEAGWRLLSTTAGLPLAVVATALLVLVALSSRRAARHRRREARHLLAGYAYLGLLLALPHQLLAGTSLTSSPLAALYWWGLFIAASAALLIFRFGVPLFRSFRHQLVVDEVSSEAPGVVTIWLRGRQLRHLGARAGESFGWRFLDGAGWHRAVVSPLSAVPTGDRLRITMASAEDNDRLESLTPGTWVLFEGPYGSLTVDSRTRPKLAFFASGLGIAPVRALLEDLDYGRDDAVVVYRLPDGEPALFADELDGLSERRGAEVVYLEGPTAEDRESWLPATAAAQIGDDAAVTHLVPDISSRDIYISGPEGWTATMLDALRAAGVPPSQVHAEVVAA